MLTQDAIWISLSAFAVAATCSLMGYYLTLRKQSLFGDALSHSLLPGLVLAFVISGSIGGLPMLIGAIVAGLLCSFLIEEIRNQSHIKEDTSMGIVFTSMFALGVLMLSQVGANVHLDTQCVLFGELLFVPLEDSVNVLGINFPEPTAQLILSFGIVSLFCKLFHKEFIILAFHEGVAKSLGLPTKFLHYLMMALASIAIVASFELVGAILVIGFLILPPSFGKLFFSTFKGIYLSGLAMSAFSIVLAIPLSFSFNLNPASLIIVLQFLIFVVVFTIKYLSSTRNSQNLSARGRHHA
ncbi:metal ABC transporter permease [bacterium]|nr:metal ABC transporter permease [bacterium]